MRFRLLSTLAIVVAIHVASGWNARAVADVVTLRVDGRINSAPWIAADGRFVAVAWGGAADGKADVYLAVSRDGGVTFGAPTRVNATRGEARLGGELPPRVVLRPRAGSNPEIVVLWTARGEHTEIKSARSTDGGRSFTPPITLQSSGAAGDRGWPALALDASGIAHALWLDHRGMTAAKQQPTHDHKNAAAHDGAAMAQRSGLYYAATGAATTPQERELTPGVCYCCKTALAIGPTGTLYAAWRHVYAGNLRDIAFTASRDGGRSFAPPLRVSADQWQLNGCPDDGPALAVDASDTVHVIWPTVLPGPAPEGALFYAASRDGRTFTPRQRVPTLGSPKPSHPQIAIDAGGRITVAWDEVVNGTRTAVARALSRGRDNQIAFGEPMMLGVEGPAMYPVLAPSGDALIAVWTAGAPGATVIHTRRLTPAARSVDPN